MNVTKIMSAICAVLNMILIFMFLTGNAEPTVTVIVLAEISLLMYEIDILIRK